ncbi:MAG: hypothetical protein ACMG6E_09040, partial [Candidatus Roizmanbacteria bacterium]
KQTNGVLPLLIVRTFAHIDKAMNDVTPEQKKKMNSNNGKALTKLKQRFKKYLQATGPDSNNYEVQLNKFKEDPVWSADEKKKEAKKPEKKAKKVEEAKKEEESEYDSEEEDEEEEEGDKKIKPKAKPKEAAADEEEDEEEESEEEEDEEEESEEEDEED